MRGQRAGESPRFDGLIAGGKGDRVRDGCSLEGGEEVDDGAPYLCAVLGDHTGGDNLADAVFLKGGGDPVRVKGFPGCQKFREHVREIFGFGRRSVRLGGSICCRTRFSDLLGIEHPIVQAAIWSATSPGLVAAVSNAGGLGSLGAVFGSAERLERELHEDRALTNRPFAVNHVVPLLNDEACALTIGAKPAEISLALGDPGDEVAQAHAAGIAVIHQVHTVEQARRAAALGVDAIIGQGSEAGRQGLMLGPSSMVLIPQVVDAATPISVLVAGAAADGRGLAAALVLGAQGANVGTRFLASEEAGAPDVWKRAILDAESEDVVRFDVWDEIMPSPRSGAYPIVPRILRTAFFDEWRGRREETGRQADRLRGEITAALAAGRTHDLVPFCGQTAGLVGDVLPAGEIVRRMVADTERALSEAASLQHNAAPFLPSPSTDALSSRVCDGSRTPDSGRSSRSDGSCAALAAHCPPVSHVQDQLLDDRRKTTIARPVAVSPHRRSTLALGSACELNVDGAEFGAQRWPPENTKALAEYACTASWVCAENQCRPEERSKRPPAHNPRVLRSAGIVRRPDTGDRVASVVHQLRRPVRWPAFCRQGKRPPCAGPAVVTNQHG